MSPATANATLVSRTRPSGTIPTSPAAVPVTASRQPWSECSWLISRIGPTTTSTQEIQPSSRLVPATSSLWVTVKRRASAAIRRA